VHLEFGEFEDGGVADEGVPKGRQALLPMPRYLTDHPHHLPESRLHLPGQNLLGLDL